jgi:uncharacterized protein YggU (UPF0235/DUF167 family)
MVQWFMSRAEVTVAVRVRPRASKATVGGSYGGAYGPAILVAVPEAAVGGRATRAALDAVARALRLGRDQVRLRTGERSRDKLFTIIDPPADLPERLRVLRDGAAA